MAWYNYFHPFNKLINSGTSSNYIMVVEPPAPPCEHNIKLLIVGGWRCLDCNLKITTDKRVDTYIITLDHKQNEAK